MWVIKGEGNLERTERILLLMAFIFSISKLLKSSPASEEEEGGVVGFWNVAKTTSIICGEVGQRTDPGSDKK